MRAREPDQSGYAVNDGVRIYYEVHGEGSPTLLLLPPWAIAHSRLWKMQVPYLARHFRVLVFDPRGNGRTDRPTSASAYDVDRQVGDIGAVLDASGTQSAIFVAPCNATSWAAYFFREHPERMLGLVTTSANASTGPVIEARAVHDWDEELDTDDGWAKENRHYWTRDWRGYVEFFVAQLTSEAHSTKLYDDVVSWGLETDAATMICESSGSNDLYGLPAEERDAVVAAITCPVLAIHGSDNLVVPVGRSERFAELTGGGLLVIEGAGDLPEARHPVVVNHAIKGFVDRVVPPPPRATPWVFARQRKRRALWMSSPIGLGHVLRDLAIARAVRERVPDLEIEWLAQEPVTHVLAAAGEIVHPASQDLASESAHWESEAVGHDLHAFHAFRGLDETFTANYLLFDDVVRDTSYDVCVGDESWEVDHFLHENPERKIAPYVFTTDVIGFLPVDPVGDPREAELTADYNAEMIEHRARFPHVRDLSLFLGSAEELPTTSMGPGLPGVREWAQDWFDLVPYVVPFDPQDYLDPRALRARLGYDPDAPLVAATVGGTAVGRPLLDLVAEGFAHLRKDLPEAQMVMITGPRIEPSDIADVEGLTKHAYLDEAFAHLAAADAAVVQGGLSTTMELVAAQRPFLYFPLARHWEQQLFVTHRLDHYGAGYRMDFASTTPSDLAEHLRRAMAERPRYRPVPRDGARVAGDRIAALLTGRRS
ncbi:MAG: alpha/beta fold hydrolase [Nocardioides sp.]